MWFHDSAGLFSIYKAPTVYWARCGLGPYVYKSYCPWREKGCDCTHFAGEKNKAQRGLVGFEPNSVGHLDNPALAQGPGQGWQETGAHSFSTPLGLTPALACPGAADKSYQMEATVAVGSAVKGCLGMGAGLGGTQGQWPQLVARHAVLEAGNRWYLDLVLLQILKEWDRVGEGKEN